MSQPVEDDLIGEPEAAGQSGAQERRDLFRRKFQQPRVGRDSSLVDRLLDHRRGGVPGTRSKQPQQYLGMGAEVLEVTAYDAVDLPGDIPVRRSGSVNARRSESTCSSAAT